ncbi:MAG: phosphotransferase [Acidimicrobiales bacterium]
MPPSVPPSAPPALVARVAPEWTATLAYQLVPHVTTWRLAHPDGRVRFAKVAADGAYPSVSGEAERMVWAAPYLPVPAVVALERGGGSTVLVTEALPGRDGTDGAWRDDLPGLVRALGQGLAAFHAAVGEEWCPFRFELERSLEHVHRRVEAGLVEPDRDFDHEFAHLSMHEALALLDASTPASEDLVVCHGDYCPPNVMLADGRVTGYVDLGELGVADRWRDVAIGGWSTMWNFGAAYEPLFYEGYGVEPDPDRIRFYRLLWAFAS